MKKFTVLITAVLLAFTLTACSGSGSSGGNGSDPVEIDINALAEELLTTVTSDSLSETAASLIPSIYFIDEEDIESAVSYASSGSTACEVTVIESKDEEDTKDVEEKLQSHVDSQEELYSAYNESEAARLKTAIIKSTGVYSVLCVCDDTDGAEEILKNYGF